METPVPEKILRQSIDQFWETVPKVWNLIRGHLRGSLWSSSTSARSSSTCCGSSARGMTSVSDIASARQTSRSAVSQAAELLVEKGLITRREAAGDRRFVHLEVTPAGERAARRAVHQNRVWMMEKMAATSPEDLALITEGLRLLKSIFDAPAEKAPAESCHCMTIKI